MKERGKGERGRENERGEGEWEHLRQLQASLLSCFIYIRSISHSMNSHS